MKLSYFSAPDKNYGSASLSSANSKQSSPWSHGRRPAIRLPLLAYQKVSEIL